VKSYLNVCFAKVLQELDCFPWAKSSRFFFSCDQLPDDSGGLLFLAGRFQDEGTEWDAL